jgi:hypothetical protein
MAIETSLRVSLANRAGELARVARQLANAGVNIRSVAGVAGASEGELELIVDNLGTAIQALSQGGISFRESQVAIAPLPAGIVERPGALARLAEALAGAGINVTSLYIMIGDGGQIMTVLGSSDPQKAEPILATWGA